MKKFFFTPAVLILTMIFMVGCSNDDGSSDGSEDPKGQQFKQKILIEDITSVSCMWCPLGTIAIEGLENSEYKDRVIGVGVHGDFNPSSLKDPYVLPGLNKLTSALKMSGWPHLSFDRNTAMKGTAFQSFLTQTASGVYEFTPSKFETFQKNNKLLKEGSPVGIKIESNLTTTNGKVDVNVKFGQNFNQELKYVVYIIEDGLVFAQANATAMYGNNTGNPAWAPNFVHDHVVRATNNFLGDPIAAEESVIANEFKATVDLSYTTENIENVSVVVAVLGEDGNVLNAQKAKANTTQDYEKL